MSAEVQSFIADFLRARGIADATGFAVDAAAALGRAEKWDAPTISKVLGGVRTDMFLRYRERPKSVMVGLLTERLLKRWRTPPGRTNMADSANGVVKVLFLAADPAIKDPNLGNPLWLDEEMRQVQKKVRLSDYRDRVDLVSRWAVRPDDVLQALNEVKPTVVHFSGHSSKKAGLCLMDESGAPQDIPREVIANLFHLVKDQVRLVVFNTCESKDLAMAVTKHIDCAVGMKDPIRDDAALVFSAAFYGALGFGKSVRAAFDEGLVALQLQAIPQERVPKLVSRRGVDAGGLKLVQ